MKQWKKWFGEFLSCARFQSFNTTSGRAEYKNPCGNSSDDLIHRKEDVQRNMTLFHAARRLFNIHEAQSLNERVSAHKTQRVASPARHNPRRDAAKLPRTASSPPFILPSHPLSPLPHLLYCTLSCSYSGSTPVLHNSGCIKNIYIDIYRYKYVHIHTSTQTDVNTNKSNVPVSQSS